jgi:hypothetical protein
MLYSRIHATENMIIFKLILINLDDYLHSFFKPKHINTRQEKEKSTKRIGYFDEIKLIFERVC